MAIFKAGMKVRLLQRDCELTGWWTPLFGKEATLVRLYESDEPCWEIDLMPSTNARIYVWVQSYMEPLVNPDEEAWQVFKSQLLVVNPEPVVA